MKRFTIVMIVLTLALGACAKGKQYGVGQAGCGQKGQPKCVTDLTSKKPTPKATPKKTKKPTPSPTPTKQSGPVNTFHIKIRNVANGYEPNTLRAYVGDIVIFENDDMSTAQGHTWTGDNNEWNSGVVKPGKTWRWVIDLAPKRYPGWHDESVPYLVGGPFDVLPRK